MTVQGWAIPDVIPLAHFFVGGESLCRLWKYSGPTDPEGHPSYNCRRCAAALKGEARSTTVAGVSKLSA